MCLLLLLRDPPFLYRPFTLVLGYLLSIVGEGVLWALCGGWDVHDETPCYGVRYRCANSGGLFVGGVNVGKESDGELSVSWWATLGRSCVAHRKGYILDQSLYLCVIHPANL